MHPEGVFRLISLFAGLAAVTDLGTGAHPDESLHRCIVAAGLAREVSDPARDRLVHDALVVALLEHIGCTAYSYESARVWGDDVAVTRAALRTDTTSTADVFRTFVPAVAEATGRSRPATVLTMARSMRAMSQQAPLATCEVAREAGRRLGLSPGVQNALAHMTAAWNGRGLPPVAGDAIPLPTRLMHVAGAAVTAWGEGGEEAARALLVDRAGRDLDPALVELFLSRSAPLLESLAAGDPFEAVLALEPDPVEWVDEDRLLAVARVCGDLVDLKSPWLHGHSAAVGELAGAAATALGLPEAAEVQVAGYLHDVGKVGIPGRIWNVARPWTATEKDQARLHSYHTERALARTPQLAAVARLAGAHHERCDGSGYHRGVHAERLPVAARVLAAADEYRDLVEDRPHRPGFTRAQAKVRLADDVRAGRLDGDVVEAVVAAAGPDTTTPRHRRPSGVAGLTTRQVQVLRLVTHGRTNREIGRLLDLSPRTVDRHVADIYVRIGVSSRAAAALFAMEHGLAEPTASDTPPG